MPKNAARRFSRVLAIALICTYGGTAHAAGPSAADAAPALASEDVRLVQSRELSMQLGKGLKQALMAAMAEGGPVAAIDVCRVEAPKIAAGLSDKNVRVGRTALKVRNPLNSADSEQRRVLESFEQRLAAGEPGAGIEQFDHTYRGGARYMKAIVTQPMCLACHGPSLAPDIAAAIRERYPDDAATGFEAGSLRGAFVVDWSGAEPGTP